MLSHGSGDAHKSRHCIVEQVLHTRLVRLVALWGGVRLCLRGSRLGTGGFVECGYSVQKRISGVPAGMKTRKINSIKNGIDYCYYTDSFCTINVHYSHCTTE